MKPDGTIRLDEGLKQSHSFVFQFLECWQYIFRQIQMTGITDTGGVNRNITVADWDYTTGIFAVTLAALGISTYGLVVGSGIAAESNTDIALDTQIAHGIGADQLQYSAHSYVPTQIVGTNVDFQMQRSFTNGSGGPITINEIGVYCAMYSGGYRYFCLARDVVGATVIPDGEIAIVTYIIRTTV